MTIRDRTRAGRGLSVNGGDFPVKGGKAGIGRRLLAKLPVAASAAFAFFRL
jgi:hypothetical protein